MRLRLISFFATSAIVSGGGAALVQQFDYDETAKRPRFTVHKLPRLPTGRSSINPLQTTFAVRISAISAAE